MPSKKKKYNARFPAGRIKKIMQTDEEVGKVAQAVPVIISRTLELFVESLLTKTLKITNARNAKTLSPSHMKQCIISESRFDFLRDLVKNIPDIGMNEDLSGSEAGYGNEGTSPASTSTSSSYSNGTTSGGLHLPYEGHHPVPLQRSESYTPAATATISLLPHSSPHTGSKRGLTQGGSLNFYKEIPLEETTGSPPPPKLNRLNSAPAGTGSTALPFKIDILPNLPTAIAGTAKPLTSSAGKSPQTAITPQITYKFERLAAVAVPLATPATTSAVTLEPVIKLDYSNLRLPATSASTLSSGLTTSRTASLQPTIKIDLSSIANADGGTPPKHTGTGGSKHNSSSTGTTTSVSGHPITPGIQSPVAAAPPLFATLSSTIPGMDEDYDDI